MHALDQASLKACVNTQKEVAGHISTNNTHRHTTILLRDVYKYLIYNPNPRLCLSS